MVDGTVLAFVYLYHSGMSNLRITGITLLEGATSLCHRVQIDGAA
jgi:hypothetical protein